MDNKKNIQLQLNNNDVYNCWFGSVRFSLVRSVDRLVEWLDGWMDGRSVIWHLVDIFKNANKNVQITVCTRLQQTEWTQTNSAQQQRKLNEEKNIRHINYWKLQQCFAHKHIDVFISIRMKMFKVTNICTQKFKEKKCENKECNGNKMIKALALALAIYMLV